MIGIKNYSNVLTLLKDEYISIQQISKSTEVPMKEIEKIIEVNNLKKERLIFMKEKLREILFLLYYREDLTCYAISKRLGINSNIVYEVNKKYKIRDTSLTYKRAGYDGTEKESIVKDYLKNSRLTSREIANIAGVSINYVYGINKKYNFREH